MIRSIFLFALFSQAIHGGGIEKPFAIPVHEKQGHSYKIPVDNNGDQLKLASIALYTTKNTGLFAEYNETKRCAEFFTPNFHEEKCDGIFFLLHSDHYSYVRHKLDKYLTDRKNACKDPVGYKGTLLILDKPDRTTDGAAKHIGNFIEKDNTISYILDGKPIVIEMVQKKIARNLLPSDRFEILCKILRL